MYVNIYIYISNVILRCGNPQTAMVYHFVLDRQYITIVNGLSCILLSHEKHVNSHLSYGPSNSHLSYSPSHIIAVFKLFIMLCCISHSTFYMFIFPSEYISQHMILIITHYIYIYIYLKLYIYRYCTHYIFYTRFQLYTIGFSHHILFQSFPTVMIGKHYLFVSL